MSGTQSFEGRAEWLRDTVAQGQTGAARFHPDLEEMAAYTEGGLAPGRRAEIQEHLVACASCARFVLDLAQVAAEAFPASPAAESAARWEKLHPRLVEEGLALPKMAPAMAARKISPSTNGWRSWGVGLAMALVASLLYNGQQWKMANQPRIVEEEVALSVTRGEAEAQVITLAERSRHRDLVLRIDANSTETLSGLRAELLTWPEKRRVWSGTLEREGRQLMVAVPTASLDPREYQIQLWGRTAEGWKKVGLYPIQISFSS